jgi:hypothetical protein
LLSPLNGICYLSGHEGSLLGLFNDLYSKIAGMSLLLLRLLGGWLDLSGLALLLLFLSWLEWHRGVGLGCLLSEELVHPVVGLSNHFSGFRSASPIPSGGLLGDRGLHEGGPVGGGQVGQMERQLGLLNDGIR